MLFSIVCKTRRSENRASLLIFFSCDRFACKLNIGIFLTENRYNVTEMEKHLRIKQQHLYLAQDANKEQVFHNISVNFLHPPQFFLSYTHA